VSKLETTIFVFGFSSRTIITTTMSAADTPAPEEIIRSKCGAFEDCCRGARWDELVRKCYYSGATLNHFAAEDGKPIRGRDAIVDFFRRASPGGGGYSLNLQYAIVRLNSGACLVAGVGSIDGGPWCPFAERWELAEDDRDWYIVEDKVSAPETWMV